MVTSIEQHRNSGIGIYPGFLANILEAGTTREFTVTIENNYGVPIKVETSAGEFAQNPNTLQNYLVNTDSFSDWLSHKTVTLGAKSTKTITFTIAVPENTTVTKGSYYPALVLAFEPANSQDTGFTHYEHVIPLYIEIGENAISEVDVVEFRSDRFVFGTKIAIDTTIANIGNTYTRPVGYLEFYQVNLLTKAKTRIDTIPLNASQVTLLPQSRFTETLEWSHDQIGNYESILYLLDDDSPVPIDTLSFWIIPTQWVIIAVVVTAVILGMLAARILYLKKRKRREKSSSRGKRRLRTSHQVSR